MHVIRYLKKIEMWSLSLPVLGKITKHLMRIRNESYTFKWQCKIFPIVEVSLIKHVIIMKTGFEIFLSALFLSV